MTLVPVLAIDIGGTKLAAAVVDAAGALHGAQRADTGRECDGEALFGVLCGVAGAALEAARATTDARPVALGVGCGGPMGPAGELVSPLNIPAWRDFALRSRLAGWAGLPAFVDNDAKALARAEGWLGAAQGERDYLAMVVSTGVGAGLVVEGRLLDGATGNAGHIGHVIVEPGGRRCACGAQGCLEAEASGRSIETMTGRPAADAPVAVRRRTGRLVGRAVASVVSLLDVRLAVVAGSVALGYGDDFFAAANDELAERSRLVYTAGARIAPAGLGADGPLLGAAAVAHHGLASPV